MNANRPVVVGLGEVLWDVFPDGPRFGGAPGNFACHAAALGAEAHMASCVGPDELGDRALEALGDHSVGTSAVARCDRPTGTVQVTLDEAGRPRFEITTDVAWDYVPWSSDLASLAARTDAVSFGTLAQRSETSRETIRRLLAASQPAALKILDVNLRPPFYDENVILDSLRLANVLKLSDEELPVLAKACGMEGEDVQIIQQLGERFDLRMVVLTLGGSGAMLVRDGHICRRGASPTTVADTVGAGDSFTAAMTLGLLADWPLDDIARRAIEVAAYVCSQQGATPRLPDAIRQAFL